MSIYPLYYIPLFALLGAILNGMIALVVARQGNKVPEKWVSFLGVFFPLASFAVVLTAVWPFIFQDASAPRIETLFPWISSGHFKLDFALRMDRLSALMALVVTGVGSLIHLYSTGYMHGDKGFAKYFAYLNLFLFAMILLILGDNLLVLFIGWEGVGLCSYLLIGFWFEDPAKAAVGKKAFVVNRIGDFGFLLALFVIASILLKNPDAASAGIFSFSTLEQYKDLLAPLATLICLLLFLGAAGKSAQIPLYVWLPDAMAGPTPVSALIHAATMVTAGVYMVARLSFLYDLAPFARDVVASVGAATAFFAATIGLAQRDIKKVLAYSTVSQLGYMFLGVGIGANAAGIFHLMTHAFFKACLFLGSGSVIHALHGEQDIFKMGGLRKHLPVTFWTFLICTLTIAGLPPFSGFFSKDEILWQAFARGYTLPWALAFLAAGLTAFYMFRLVCLTFFGKSRVEPSTLKHLHLPSFSMDFPLVILALLAMLAGVWGIPHALGGSNLIHHWLASDGGRISEQMENETLEMKMAALSAAWAAFWALLSIYLFTQKWEAVGRFILKVKGLYTLIYEKYYIDEIYEALFVKPLYWISRSFLWKGVDSGVIDGMAVNGSAKASEFMGRMLGLLQNGMANSYALYFVTGLVGLIWWVLK